MNTDEKSKDEAVRAGITRREAIYRVSAMLGGVALVGQSAMLAGCDGAPPETAADTSPDPMSTDAGLFSAGDVELLDDVADTMLPETDTPSARAAGVGPFMALMVTDSYYPDDQQIFRSGLEDIQARSRDGYGAEFAALTDAQRLELVEALDAEQHAHGQSNPPGAPAHYFRMMKELALFGYFTSEVGYMQAMRYVETPGRFDPCVPLEAGGKTWADHA